MSLTNNQVWQAKQNANIVSIIEAAGTELRPAGGERLKGLCPLHSEKTPSFIVYQSRRRFHCFGCGQGGDVIDFIQETRGLSFLEALKALGADDYRISKSEIRAIKARQRRQKAQRRRERDLAYTLGRAIRIAKRELSGLTRKTFTPHHTFILQNLSILEYQHSIFIDGDTDDRAALVRDLVTITPFPKGKLFNDEFDYRRWNSEATKKTDEVKNGQREENKKTS